MKQYRRLLIAMAILLSGAALIPYISLSSEPFRWQRYADIYEPDQPSLAINYVTGQPDSFFSLIGNNFPSDEMATVSINGETLGTVSTNSDGVLGFVLDTANADEGFYGITASAGVSASVGFLLDADAPLRLQEDTGTTFEVPAGIGLTEFVYLPFNFR